MSSEMLAGVFHGKKDVRLEGVKIPQIKKSDDVLLEVKVGGICGSDLRIISGHHPVQKIPVILCHEYTGLVEEVGEDVNHVKRGDKVVIDPNIKCGTCFYCRLGRSNLCANRRCLGQDADGGFAEYNLAPAGAVYKIPNDMSFKSATLVEPLSCVLHGVKKCKVSPADTVAIFGAGPIGLLMIQSMKNVGADVIVSEISQGRLALAEKLGADLVINPGKEDFNEKVKKVTEGRGADIVVDAVGNATVSEQAIKIVRPGGKICLFGITPEEAEWKGVKPFHITWREIEIFGSFIMADTYPSAIQLLYNNKYEVDKIVTHTFKIEEIFKGIELAESGEAVKVQIIPS